MDSSLGLVTMILFLCGQTRGDSVTQTEGQVTLLEEASLTINCTYTTTRYPELYWYVQYPGEGPKVLLKAQRDKDIGREKGFEATYLKDSNSFHLEKAAVQESDSAVYYCAVSDTVTRPAGGAEHKPEQEQGISRGENVKQHPSAIMVQEGKKIVLNCTYSDSASNYFYWYKKEPGKSLQFIIFLFSNTPNNQKQRFTILLNKNDKQLALHIEDIQPGDSAVYYCAVSPQCFPGIYCMC